MENFFFSLVETNGPLVAALVSIVIIGAGLYLKFYGPTLFASSSDIKPSALDGLNEKVGQIDIRLRRVELDVEHLPTRQEFHEMALQLAKLDGKIMSLERTTQATGHAVGRIEDHFIRMSGGTRT